MGAEGGHVLVIGAGPCGLTSLKALKAEGLASIVCFEADDDLGGNWRFRPCSSRSGVPHSSVYETTHIISSKKLSAFDDFPMPDDYPDFPSHRQMLAYFEDYARAFDLRPHIRFGTRVTKAEPLAGGGWEVASQRADGARTVERFDHVLVATGHHSDPVMPDFPGRFDGTLLHSHAYKSAAPFRDARVLVVGGGNSACDIAVETARVSERTAISMRRGYPIVPKLVFGKPADVQLYRLRHLPRLLRRPVAAAMLRLAIGRYERYGLKPPAGGTLEQHPTLNSDLLNALRHGLLDARPGIAALDGDAVLFEGGRREPFDTIILATGYRRSLPFLPAEYGKIDTAEPPPLYLKMTPASTDTLHFIGMFQPIGCIWNLADYQARIAAARISGRLAPPRDLAKRIARERARPHWPFEKTHRHAIEVDFHEFRRDLLAELKGRRAA